MPFATGSASGGLARGMNGLLLQDRQLNAGSSGQPMASHPGPLVHPARPKMGSVHE